MYNMFLPNNKKYLLYIKVAKTGGTSFLKYLNDLSLEINQREVINFKIIDNKRKLDREPQKNDIIMVVNDNFKKFKLIYPEILENSYIIIISRNPYQKFLSCYHYHPECKGKSMIDLLNSKYLFNYNSFETDYKTEQPKRLWNYFSLYTHLLAPQITGLLTDDKNSHIAHKILKFENLNNDIEIFKNNLNIESNISLFHLNKGIEYEKNINNNHVKKIINQLFKDDFKYLNYQIDDI